VAEFFKFKPVEVFKHRVASLSSLQGIGDSGVVSQHKLKFLIVACFSPMIAGAVTGEGDRADNVGEYFRHYQEFSWFHVSCLLQVVRPSLIEVFAVVQS
jgi:hypothetical protein